MAGKNYIETINGVSFKMIFVKGGKVTLEYDNQKAEITVPDYYLAETPVTQALWRAVMGKDPERLRFKGQDENPVERVSWLDIVEGNKETNEPTFLNQLNQSNQLQFKDYRLPSEAMWQFAAQGGNQSNAYTYAGSNHLKEVGWYDSNSHGETKPVKLKMPIELGFYDMSGNVWEWCQDKWTRDLAKLPKDGLPNNVGDNNKNDLRVVRGGSWFDNYSGCRVSYRFRFISNYRNYIFGFRLSRYLPLVPLTLYTLTRVAVDFF